MLRFRVLLALSPGLACGAAMAQEAATPSGARPSAAGAVAAEPWMVFADGLGALALGAPQSQRLGPGGMLSGGLYRSLGPMLAVGARLRAGVLSDGDPPPGPGLADYGAGGWLGAQAALRLRPLAARDAVTRQHGLWLEAGVGGGVTGKLVRPAFEAGLGWHFPVRLGGTSFALGPTARYLHVLAPGRGLDTRDARIVMLGVELALRDARPAPPPPEPEAPPPEPAAAPQDSDGDGIPDPDDACPYDAEDFDGVQDEDGCPEDNDGDGILDQDDRCPMEPETVNGIDDEDGCPDQGEIELVEGRVILEEHVLFDLNRSRVKSSGRRALAAILNLWKQHPDWVRMEIEGHASADGPEAYNVTLSSERAQRVADVLVELGFPRDKLTARGFGSSRPRDPRDTPEALARNRRVEFVIIDRAPAPGPEVAP